MQNHSGSVEYITRPPPIVGELEILFSRLSDDSLIDKFILPIRRGPKGYPARVLWRCFVVKHYMGLQSTDALIRTLRNNPWVAEACGIESVPHKSTFSRFFKKLSYPKFLHLVKDVSRSAVRRHYRELPGFGERVALDSTTLKAWSNGGKDPKADLEAGWSIKKGTQGPKEFVYGWKLHLVVDCESEMPIGAHVSPGNVHDMVRATNTLRQCRVSFQGFHPRYFMADAGYAGRKFMRHVKRQYRAIPIVNIPRHLKKFRATYGEILDKPEGMALSKQRQSVERVFSRLKGQRSLNSITTRGLEKVTLHCYLSLIAMQVASSMSVSDIGGNVGP